MFVAAALVGTVRHEMWRDEFQAWMIARDSGSFTDLIRNMGRETHPLLWHTLLWILTRLTADPFAMQILHLGIACAGVALLLRCAPFSRTEKALLAFGYFSLFEYALVARSYVLSLVLVYAFCALFASRRRTLLPLAAVLFLMANTNPHGLVLAATLASVLAADRIAGGCDALRRHAADTVAAFGIIAAGVALSVAQLARTTAGSPRRLGSSSIPTRALDALTGVWQAHVPVPDPGARAFWQSDLVGSALREVTSATGANLIVSVLSLAVLALGVVAVARSALPLLLHVVGSAMFVVFAFAVMPGGLRHHGFFYMVLLAAMWLSRELPDTSWRSPAMKRLAALSVSVGRSFFRAVLTLQVIAGVMAWGADFRRPFSLAGATAEFIRAQRLDALPMFGDRAPPVSAVQAQLDKPICYLSDGRMGSYVVWGPKTFFAKADENRLWRNFARYRPAQPRGEALLIANYPVAAIPRGYRVGGIRDFTGSLVGDEDFFLYRVEWDEDGP